MISLTVIYEFAGYEDGSVEKKRTEQWALNNWAEHLDWSLFSESPPTAQSWRGWTWTTAWLSLTRSSTHSLPKTRSAILSSEWHRSKDQLYMISLLPRHALEMVQNEPGMKSLVLKIMDPRQSAEQKRYVGGADITQKWSCLHQVSMSQGLKGAAEIYGWFWSSCCGLWEPYW